MLYLYSDKYDSYYVLCNPDTFRVGLWNINPTIAIESYFLYTEPDSSHSTFTDNRYTLITTYPYDTLADFQANHPELFI